MGSSTHAEDLLEWSCKFCRVGVGQVHKCTAVVGPTCLQIKWWTFPSPVQRERKLHAHNILRASMSFEPKLRVTVHVLTTPDVAGDAEYKTYEFTEFAAGNDAETFAAAVNAVAFSERPLGGRVLVFVNPISGSRSGPKRFKAVEPLFKLVGLECEVITTTHHGHAAEFIEASNLDAYSAIVSVSGDGTLNEIFTGLISRSDGAKAVTKPVGIIPAGSEGTLAKISTYFNPFAAVYIILKSHEVRPLDVLKIEQDNVTVFSVCGVGWGLPGKVAEQSEQLRSTYGRSRYAVSAVKEFVSWKGCAGVLEVLPAKERPLCTCGPGCLRCRSGAELATTRCRSRDINFQPATGNPVAIDGGEGRDEWKEPANVAVFSLDELDESCGGGGGHEEGAGRVNLPAHAGKEEEEEETGETSDVDQRKQIKGEIVPKFTGSGPVGLGNAVDAVKEEKESNAIREKEAETHIGEAKGGAEEADMAESDVVQRGQGAAAAGSCEHHVQGRDVGGESIEAGDQDSVADSVADSGIHNRRQGQINTLTIDATCPSAEGYGAKGGWGGSQLSPTGESGVGGAVGVVQSPSYRANGFLEPPTSSAEKRVVVLDYGMRVKGHGDVADRGSALLYVAEKYREEEEDLAVLNGSIDAQAYVPSGTCPHGHLVKDVTHLGGEGGAGGASSVVSPPGSYVSANALSPSTHQRHAHSLTPSDHSLEAAGAGVRGERGEEAPFSSTRAAVVSSPAGRMVGAGGAKREVWQRLEGSFVAIGALNTEKISAPYVHMSDGCMDVIAVPAAVGRHWRMDFFSMGIKLANGGGHLRDRRLFHWKATQMRFRPLDPSDKYNVDGEVLEGKPISITVLPSLARLISVKSWGR